MVVCVQHVDSQCKTWMKETEDAMASKLAIERTPQILVLLLSLFNIILNLFCFSFSRLLQELVGNVIELHTKLFGHVAVCFANESQFVEVCVYMFRLN